MLGWAVESAEMFRGKVTVLTAQSKQWSSDRQGAAPHNFILTVKITTSLLVWHLHRLNLQKSKHNTG